MTSTIRDNLKSQIKIITRAIRKMDLRDPARLEYQWAVNILKQQLKLSKRF